MASLRATVFLQFIVSLVALPCLAFAQAGSPAPKWEYAELHHAERSGSSDNPEKVFQSAIKWISGDGYVQAYGWRAIAEKLKAPELKKFETENPTKGTDKEFRDAAYRLQFRNYLGNQGWELVAHRRDDRGDSEWIFKRAVSK